MIHVKRKYCQRSYHYMYTRFHDYAGTIFVHSNQKEGVKISEVNYNINNYYGIGYPEEMLDRARVKYNADDIGGAVDIYMNLFLKDNPTACCNMGYLYANGIYVEKSLDIARRYFEHAIEFGDETARLEILAMYLENDMSQAIKYLEENADIEIIVHFFQNNFEDVSLFWESDAGKQAEILQEKFLLQEESIEEYPSAQSSNDWVKFELIGSRQELDERNSVYKTMYTYRVYRWKLIEPEMLRYEIR